MDLLATLLAVAPDDPIVLAMMVFGAWLPVCALGLGVLALLATLQQRLALRRKPRPVIEVPPTEMRPLATRRYVTVGARTGGVAAATRLVMVIVAVGAFTAMVLSASGPLMLTMARG